MEKNVRKRSFFNCPDINPEHLMEFRTEMKALDLYYFSIAFFHVHMEIAQAYFAALDQKKCIQSILSKGYLLKDRVKWMYET